MRHGTQWDATLRETPPAQWAELLDQNSGLPGPRANLELVSALTPLAEQPMIETLLSSGDEYHAMCAASALGFRAGTAAAEKRARALAADERWRVREGVAIGLQLLGDQEPTVMASIVRSWVEDADPLVQRAAVAAISEPRLLRDAEISAAALRACARATRQLAAQPAALRKMPHWRTLRQALGYCWSVAVAADPDRGLALFRGLNADDPDIAWIVAQNVRKKRLASLLEK